MPPTVGDVNEAVRLSDAYIDTKNYDRARQVLRTALSQWPDEPDLLASNALLELRLQNYKSAETSASAALAVSPHHPRATNTRVYALQGLGYRDGAVAAALRAVHDFPHESWSHHTYAKILLDCKRFTEALPAVEEGLRLRPNDDNLLNLRGAVLQGLRRFKEAEADYRAALAVNPENPWAMMNLAQRREDRGRLGKALAGHLGVARIDPTDDHKARDRVGLVVVRLMRRITSSATLMGVVVMFAASSQGGGPLPRIIVGVWTAALIAGVVWLYRRMHLHTWRAMLRSRPYLFVRLAHALGAVVLGVVMAGGFVRGYALDPYCTYLFWGGLSVAFFGVLLDS